MSVGGQRHAPVVLPPGKTRYELYRRLGGPQGRSGRVQKISPSPGFVPRTVQPVASRYTEWAIQAPVWTQVQITRYATETHKGSGREFPSFLTSPVEGGASRSGSFGVEKNLLPLPGIEPVA